MLQTTNQPDPQGAGRRSDDHFARHGGVHFRLNATPQEINNFVRKLPAGKRDSLFEVMDQLDSAGLITVMNDHLFADGDGTVGGGDPDFAGKHSTELDRVNDSEGL
ncbi:hypothetical protein [Brevibacillus sp. SYP-B805]|uniref:hypothetical protein n=1 Tax=Brevibacillus sp. SYP-B805 TaxID=1578199 RepID=UPI001F498CC6|nr:hypothetical protein [Brevibacillus sp. SYP-B805]